jgi:hypothetical protein
MPSRWRCCGVSGPEPPSARPHGTPACPSCASIRLPTLIKPASDAVARLFNGLGRARCTRCHGARRGALAAVLRGVRLGYHEHRQVAVGPADGPTASTLTAALRSTFGVGDADPDPAWTVAVAEAGGLP